MADQLNCPTCGAPVELQNRFVCVVNCDFCDVTSIVKGDSLDSTGRRAKLTKMPSIFFVDALGKLDGKSFKVLGRLRYEYDGGLWDEWFLSFDSGENAWLVEEAATYKLLFQQPPDNIPEYFGIKVGTTIQAGGRDVYVIEKGTAKIIGGEGQLGFNFLPGDSVYYVDGSCGDELVSIEYDHDDTEFLTGRMVDRESVEVLDF